MRRIIMAALGAAVGVALLVAPASAAPSLTVYRPAITAAGSYVTVKAKTSGGAYCSIGIAGVLSYGHSKRASSAGNVSWRPRVPSSATGGDHRVTVRCLKSGQRTTRYTTLVVTHTYFWEGSGDADFSTEDLRIPSETFTVIVEVDGGAFRYLSAEWQNASGSRFDFFFTQSGPTREVSHEGKTTGWFNVEAGDATYWRLTVSGIAE